MPPAKKKPLTSKEKLELLHWLADKDSHQSGKTGRLLTEVELKYSLRDLLGLEREYHLGMPERGNGEHFSNSNKYILSAEDLSSVISGIDKIVDNEIKTTYPKSKTWNLDKLLVGQKLKGHSMKNGGGAVVTAGRHRNGKMYYRFWDGFIAPEDGLYEIEKNAGKFFYEGLISKVKAKRTIVEEEDDNDFTLVIGAGESYLSADQNIPVRTAKAFPVTHTLKKTKFTIDLRKGESLGMYAYSKSLLMNRLPSTYSGVHIKSVDVTGPVYHPETVFKRVAPDADILVDDSDEGQRFVTILNGSEELLTDSLKKFSRRAFSDKLSTKNFDLTIEPSIEQYRATKDFIACLNSGVKSILLSIDFQTKQYGQSTDAHKVASFLSRALWLSNPDSELLELAENQSLENEKVIETQLDRMLDDPRATRFLDTFIDEWLGMKEYERSRTSVKLNPTYDVAIDIAMKQEVYLYFQHLFKNDKKAPDLIDSDYLIVNQDLASHYGIEAVCGGHFREVQLPKDSVRGGLLTMGAVLKVSSNGIYTSPILRGARISNNLVGNPISPPPPTVDTNPKAESDATTIKQQLDDHQNARNCYSCHKEIDPYGIALESFDNVGSFRTKYRKERLIKATFDWSPRGAFAETQPVDPSGDVHGTKFNDVAELKALILQDEKKIAYNFSKILYQFFNGEEPGYKSRLQLHEKVSANMTVKEIARSTVKISIQELIGLPNE